MSFATDVTTALDLAVAKLKNGTRDGGLAAKLDSLSAAALEEESGDAVTRKRWAALVETLSGIAARLRG